MAESIGTLNAKVTADASQFVSEFNRADNAARRASTNMEREIGELARKIKKKFELGDVGKDILRGAGLFGGFEIARTASDAIVDQFRIAAESAKEQEAASQRQLELTRQIIQAKMTEREKELYFNREIEKTNRELTQAKGDKLSFSLLEPGKWGENFRAFLSGTDKSEEATKKIDELTEAMQRLGLESERIKKRKEDTEKALMMVQTNLRGLSGESLRKAENETRRIIEGPDTAKDRERMIRAINKQRALDKQYLNEALADEQKTGGKITPEIQERIANFQNRLAKETEELNALLKEQYKLGNDIGEAFANSFEKAILEGGKFGDVLKSLARDVLALFIKSQVTTPLAGMLGAFFNGFGGPRAEGGPVSGGKPYLVGEEGPELMVPNGSGTIIPAGRTAAMMGGGGGNVVNNFHWSFGAGVTAQQVAAMIPNIINQTKAAVAESVQRGGSYRRAFA